MATIEELHWAAILDTTDFDKSAKKLREDAGRLNKDLSDMLEIYNKMRGKTLITEKGVKNAKEFNAILSEIQQKMSQLPSSVKVHEEATKRVSEEVKNTNRHYTTQSTLLRQLTTLAGTYFSVRGAEKFLKSLVNITGEFEVQKMALTSMLQSSEVADSIFNQYRRLALNSPFTFQDFTKFGKQLTAFNIPANELIDTTKMLADVAAGLGVDMGRIILAYGQIKSAGVLKGTELRQLTEAGVPILESLAKQIEETTGKAVKLGDVFAMITKKQIPFEMVEQAFRDMTSEGGKFYNMQEVLVETLQGKIGKLRDVWQQALYDMGSESSINKLLKGSVDLAIKLVGHLDAIGRVLAPIIAGFGAYGTALAVVAVGQKALDLANFVRALIGVANGSKAAAAALTIMGGAGKMAAASLGALAVLGVGIYELVKIIKKTNDEAHRMNTILRENDNALNEEKTKLEEINERLRINAKGTKEWLAAKKEAVGAYGQYFKGLNSEIDKVGDLSTAYDALTASIIEATRARQVANFQNQEEERLNANAQKDLESFEKRLSRNYSRAEVTMIMNEVRRAINTGGDLNQIRNNKTVASLIGKRKWVTPSIGGILTRSNLGRSQYEEDLRTLVYEYGLQGTEFDPDFNGPIRKKGGKATPNTGSAWGTSGGNDKAINDRIAAIKKEITNLQRWKDIYDKLAADPLLGKEGAGVLMGGMFETKDLDFVKQIEDKLTLLNDEFKGRDGIAEYIEGIKASLGKDATSDIMRLLDAFKKVAEARDKMDSKDHGAVGTGALYDITKTLEDGITKINEAGEKRRKNEELLAKVQAGDEEDLKLLREALGAEAWKKYVENGEAAFEELEKAEKDSIRKSVQDRLSAIAKTYANEVTQGLDMKDWDDKSLRQINGMLDKFIRLRAQGMSGLLNNEKLQASLKTLGVDFKVFADEYDRLLDLEQDKIIEERLKKVIGNAKSLLDMFGRFGGVFGSFGEKTNNDTLKNLGNVVDVGKQIFDLFASSEHIINDLLSEYNPIGAFEEISDAAEGAEELAEGMADVGDEAKDAAEAASGLASTMDWISFIVKAVLIVVEQIANAIAGDYERQIALNEAEKEYRDVLKEIARLKNDGYFGEDALGMLATNWELATQAANKYKEVLSKDGGKTTWNSFWGGKTIYGNLTDLSKQFPELYNSDGTLNMEYVKAYKDVLMGGTSAIRFDGSNYWGLSGELKALLDELINVYDEMKEATEAFANSIKDIFGALADTIADGMVDSFLETGDALGNLDKSFEDFGETVARTMLKSLLSAKMMEKFEGRLNALAESYMMELGSAGRESADMKFAEMLGSLAKDMKEFAEGSGDFANSFLSAMQSAGLLGSGSGESGALANGIKGITEDTANLIASYMNAIRADVSVMRSMADTGWKDVNAILVDVNILPTLNDYMAQVAATNHDIAQSNQQILSEIQSVITSASGRRAIAVDVQ